MMQLLMRMSWICSLTFDYSHPDLVWPLINTTDSKYSYLHRKNMYLRFLEFLIFRIMVLIIIIIMIFFGQLVVYKKMRG
ncbi:hypothetical protein EUGRSUZ_D01162 [Eucalyptus grandis]|uniref:Uncharacterized protein n=2 Tax=Eucalyptus grandis TaxID=71139 RepID=A0A059CFV3_EUCGR|nr:hypothetical protein EUGRSUZ_D01162 [Eucalyptus grandis]